MAIVFRYIWIRADEDAETKEIAGTVYRLCPTDDAVMQTSVMREGVEYRRYTSDPDLRAV